jgi:hypothetical protein
MKQKHNPIQRQSRRQNQRRPILRTARLQLEQLEDRTAPSVSVIENFEAGNLSAYSTALRFAPSAVILPIAAHDGLQGLVKQDGYEWMIREDSGSTVHAGDTVSVWTQFAGVADGRAYLGFDSHDIAPAHAPLSTGGTLSVVMAANTNQLIIQKDAGGNGVASFNNVATVGQTYQADHWYRLEATWGADGHAITANLYDSDGTTLLNSVTGTTTAPFPSGGGIAFRGFGHDKYFDTVVLDTGSTGSVDERANAGGGLDPNWVPGDPPAPVGNGPSGNPAPVPWHYTSTPGSGIEVRLAAFNDLQPVAIVGSTVGLAAGNTSYIAGTRQVGWGDPLETPLLAQYIFRQRPDEATQLIGASSTKHFFSSAHSDSQHLNPGESDSYGSGLNTVQDLYTYGSEIDPVTGTLHSPIDRGNLSVDGIVNNSSRHFSSPIDLLLQVSVADLDPAQNPDGTKWYLMGNLFVGGEEDASQASRWVEIVPHLNGTTFSFSYPNGAGGQLNFRTIPALVDPNATGPQVVHTDLTGTFTAQVDHDHLVFNTAIDPASFTFDQYAITAPNGSTINATTITPTDGTNTQFDVTFPAQTTNGTYTLTVGPNITDAAGNPMSAPFTSTFTINIAVGGNLIVNGDFESGSFSPGWTQSGNTGATGVDGGNVHSGNFAAFLGPVGSDGFIAQTFGTSAGSTYVLDYWLEHDGGSPSDFYAQIDGATVAGSRLDNPPAFAYTEYTFTFVAAGPTTELKFGFREDPTYFHLDDVSVSRAPGPPSPHGGGSHLPFVTPSPLGGAGAAQRGTPISGLGSAAGLSGQLGADRFAAGFASIAQPSFAGAGTAGGAESVQPAFSHNDLLTSSNQGDRWRTAISTSGVQGPSHASDGSDPFADPTGADNWWWV